MGKLFIAIMLIIVVAAAVIGISHLDNPQYTTTGNGLASPK